ncbi:unnamed protein product [Cuscuta campestris]|uniref:Uncharacterized protein n=1 Tax=Cuscuta campestris TaxID=132261 RepID=A0A484K8W0_9ASTE|nr:unnamed protein product [Cuscuta campestris]
MMEPIAEVVCLLKVDVHCDECKLSLMRVLSSISEYYGYQTCPRALSGYGYNQEVNSYGGYRPPPAQYASSSYPLRRADEYIAVADPSVPLCTIM